MGHCNSKNNFSQFQTPENCRIYFLQAPQKDVTCGFTCLRLKTEIRKLYLAKETAEVTAQKATGTQVTKIPHDANTKQL